MNKEVFSYERYLDEKGSLTYSNVGKSMLPLLKEGRDLFTVAKKGSGRCKKYDVVLYRSPDGKYVLHRIVKVKKDGYVILGDNCSRREYGITDGDILGVMTSFVRRGKEHSVTEPGYRFYSVWRVCTAPVRIFFAKARIRLRRKLGKKKQNGGQNDAVR